MIKSAESAEMKRAEAEEAAAAASAAAANLEKEAEAGKEASLQGVQFEVDACEFNDNDFEDSDNDIDFGGGDCTGISLPPPVSIHPPGISLPPPVSIPPPGDGSEGPVGDCELGEARPGAIGTRGVWRSRISNSGMSRGMSSSCILPDREESLRLRIENMNSLVNMNALISGFLLSVMFEQETSTSAFLSPFWAYAYLVVLTTALGLTISSLLINSLCSYYASRMLAYYNTPSEADRFMDCTGDLRSFSVPMTKAAIVLVVIGLGCKQVELVKDRPLLITASSMLSIIVFFLLYVGSSVNSKYHKVNVEYALINKKTSSIRQIDTSIAEVENMTPSIWKQMTVEERTVVATRILIAFDRAHSGKFSNVSRSSDWAELFAFRVANKPWKGGPYLVKRKVVKDQFKLPISKRLKVFMHQHNPATSKSKRRRAIAMKNTMRSREKESTSYSYSIEWR